MTLEKFVTTIINNAEKVKDKKEVAKEIAEKVKLIYINSDL